MKERKGIRGSSTVEAAILFPLVIGLTLGGFVWMTQWYSQWEVSLQNHQKEGEEERKEANLVKLHWEQWGSLLREENEEKGQ